MNLLQKSTTLYVKLYPGEPGREPGGVVRDGQRDHLSLCPHPRLLRARDQRPHPPHGRHHPQLGQGKFTKKRKFRTCDMNMIFPTNLHLSFRMFGVKQGWVRSQKI